MEANNATAHACCGAVAFDNKMVQQMPCYLVHFASGVLGTLDKRTDGWPFPG